MTTYENLSAKLPKEAVQFADKEKTKRGFDMTGYSYQYVVNRLNDVLGPGGWSTKEEVEVTESKTAKGRRVFDVVCKLNLICTIDEKEVVRTAWGGSDNSEKADAIKGAWTQAFKRAASLIGIGKEAYEGTIDSEFRERTEDEADKTTIKDDFDAPIEDDEFADDANETPKVISDAQRKRLRAIQTSRGISDEHLKQIIKEIGKVDSSKLILVKDYDAICKEVERK